VGENLGPELALIAGLSFPKIRSLCDGFSGRTGPVDCRAVARDRRAGRPLYWWLQHLPRRPTTPVTIRVFGGATSIIIGTKTTKPLLGVPFWRTAASLTWSGLSQRRYVRL